MNQTNFEHAGYALLMMLICWAATDDIIAGMLFPIGFFIGREHAQAQSEYLLGDFAAFDVRKWSLDAQLDLLFPVLMCVLVVVGYSLAVHLWEM